MARQRPSVDPSRIAEISSFVGRQTEQAGDPRKGRSKRGIDLASTSQVCFRIEKARHKKLRLYCLEHDKEIGEVMDELIRDHLGI